MDVEYRNRSALEPEKEQFLLDAADELELDADGVIIYPSEHPGMYIGRENGSFPVIGLGRDRQDYIAHELGHDRRMLVNNDIRDADPELNERGELTVQGDINDDLESLKSEIYAELVSSELSSENLERDPLEPASRIITKYNFRVPEERVDSIEVTETGYDGREYFKNPERPGEFQETTDTIRELVKEEEEYLKNLIYSTWSQNIDSCAFSDREHLIWGSVDSFLDISYDGGSSYLIKERHGERVRNLIDERLNHIVYEINTRLGSRMSRFVFEDNIFSGEFADTVANPTHLVPKIASEEPLEGNYDFIHQVGEPLGRILHESMDLDHSHLENLEDGELESFALDALELSIEMGKYDDFYSREDYLRGIEHLGDRHLL